MSTKVEIHTNPIVERFMIVLHDLGIIFLKSRKTAGTSLEIALSDFADERDIVTPIDAETDAQRLCGPRNYKKRTIELLTQPTHRDWRNFFKGKPLLRYHNHCSAQRAKRHLGSAVWRSYEKISIVRNPWDYMVSSYYWGTRDWNNRPEFGQWCLENKKLITRNRRQYFIGTRCIIDRFLRYENLRQDILSLESDYPRLDGLSARMEQMSAKKGVRPKSGPSVEELYEKAPDVSQLIADLCDFEIERFGYKPPVGAP